MYNIKNPTVNKIIQSQRRIQFLEIYTQLNNYPPHSLNLNTKPPSLHSPHHTAPDNITETDTTHKQALILIIILRRRNKKILSAHCIVRCTQTDNTDQKGLPNAFSYSPLHPSKIRTPLPFFLPSHPSSASPFIRCTKYKKPLHQTALPEMAAKDL